MMPMDGRERALRALKREPVDRVPIYSHFRNPGAIEKLTGLDFKEDPFKATAAAYRILEIDMTKEISVPFTEAPKGYVINATGYGVSRIFPETANLEEFVEVLKKLPDIGELRKLFDFDTEVTQMKIWYDRQQEAVGDSTLITGQIAGCFDANLERFGYETFLTALVLEKNTAEAAIRYHASKCRLKCEVFVEADCSEVVMYCDDIAGLNGLLASPGIMRELWLPNMQWAVEPLMDAGIFVIYHSDGDIRVMLEDISECGFKGLHPLEPKANMDAPSIKKDWGHKFILFGGLCQVSTMLFGTVDEVREEVRRLIDGAAVGGGYFIGSSGMCGPDIPPENAIAWIEEAKEYGREFGEI